MVSGGVPPPEPPAWADTGAVPASPDGVGYPSWFRRPDLSVAVESLSVVNTLLVPAPSRSTAPSEAS
ncbi:hypothetical protein GCM10010328_35230 [Streptomyces rubiginosohelvolus]|uniref:Uncharacterized protein n=1 Tax=Streptomyces rubiginosohelvolus TaxID=67362 RepID=A0ABQ3BXM3_9ACTN|nr:hypothetical protein GCM10010328_35230 [Streptomyces pluricolorescens]